MGRFIFILFALCILIISTGCSESHNLTLEDIESSFTSAGVKYTEQSSPSEAKAILVYNGLAPTVTFNVDDNFSHEEIKIYVYPSEEEMKIGLEQLRNEQSKDLTYGLKETSMIAHNVMFLSKWFTEKDMAAIKKLK